MPQLRQNIKEWIKATFPGAVTTYRNLYYGRAETAVPENFGHAENMKEVFTRVFHENTWMDDQSASGRGSNLEQTRVLRAELPRLLAKFNVRTMLDAPCGDFNWMKETELGIEQYIGADIVEEIVAANQRMYANDNRRFLKLDLTKDVIPEVDLILCRDGLVHLSFADIGAALENFKASGSAYLLTTTFPSRDVNKNSPTSGAWRPLNLSLSPFNFPAPLELINEECTEGDGDWADKSLGLWRLAEIESPKTV